MTIRLKAQCRVPTFTKRGVCVIDVGTRTSLVQGASLIVL